MASKSNWPARHARMERARAVVQAVLEKQEPVYGLTTGLAERKRSPLPAGSRRAFNRLLVRSHRVAQGPLASATLVRATMTCLVNNFAKGFAGVRPVLADMVLHALNDRLRPGGPQPRVGRRGRSRADGRPGRGAVGPQRL